MSRKENHALGRRELLRMGARGAVLLAGAGLLSVAQRRRENHSPVVEDSPEFKYRDEVHYVFNLLMPSVINTDSDPAFWNSFTKFIAIAPDSEIDQQLVIEKINLIKGQNDAKRTVISVLWPKEAGLDRNFPAVAMSIDHRDKFFTSFSSFFLSARITRDGEINTDRTDLVKNDLGKIVAQKPLTRDEMIQAASKFVELPIKKEDWGDLDISEGITSISQIIYFEGGKVTLSMGNSGIIYIAVDFDKKSSVNENGDKK